MKKLSSFFLLLILSAGTAAGATYYVDAANGSDSGSGISSADAWKTVARVNREAFDPGDTVLFRRGCVWTETLRPSASGSPGNPIVFGAWGPPGDAVIAGAGERSLDTNGRSHLRFEQLCFRDLPAVIEGSATVTLAACIIRNSSAEGVRIENSAGVAILNCTVTLSRFEGILAVGSGCSASVRNSLIFGNGIVDFRYGLQTGGGATLAFDHCLIGGNGYSAGLDVSRSPGIRDEGGNLPRTVPQVAGYAHGGGRFVISSDDSDVAYWKLLSAALAPHGVRFTMFLPGAFIAGRETDLAALAAAGNEIALHGWSHADLTADTLFTVSTANPSPSVTIDPVAKQITFACGDPAKNLTLSWAAIPLTLQNLRNQALTLGWTITIASEVNLLTRLSCLEGTGGPVSRFPFAATADTQSPEYAFWKDELVRGPETIRERLGVTPVTLAYPYGHENAVLREYIRTATGIQGARSTTTEWNLLSRIDISRCAGLNFSLLRGDGSEAQIRANARSAVVHARQAGCLYVIYAHHNGEMTPEQGAWFVDEVQRYGGTFATFREALEEIRNGHSTRDGFVYTREYPDRSDFHLTKDSPCIGAGTAVPVAFDYEGKPLSEGGRYDIGAVRYGDPVTVHTITASAGPGGSIDPSGTIDAYPGDCREFRIIPGTGYRICEVIVDGVSLGPVSSYRFDDVREDHSISASFVIEEPIPSDSDQVASYGFGPWKETGKKAKGISNIRIPVPASAFPAGGGWFRIAVESGNTPLTVTGAFIGEPAGTGDPGDMLNGSLRQITFRNGCAALCLAGSGREYSDWIELPRGGGREYIISLGVAGSYAAWTQAGAGSWSRDFCAMFAGIADISDYKYSHSIAVLERIEFSTSPPAPVTIPDEPEEDEGEDEPDQVVDADDDTDEDDGDRDDGDEGEEDEDDADTDGNSGKKDDNDGKKDGKDEDTKKDNDDSDHGSGKKDDDDGKKDGKDTDTKKDKDDSDRNGKNDDKDKDDDTEKDKENDKDKNKDKSTDKDKDKNKPKLRNYPNPFNAHTLIGFTLPAESEVRVSVFSISGQKVRELAEGRFGAGEHTISWNARDDRGQPLSSGIYLVRLQAGVEVHTARILYMK